jgi:hypothetical protein
MLGTIDRARTPVEAMIEPDAISAVESAMARNAHHPFLTPNCSLAAFQASALACIEASTLDALRDALLLVFTSLVNGDGMALRWSSCRCGRCLSKADG